MPEASRASAAVAGVVLAAGASTRMGRNKLLFKLGGSTVLRRAVCHALDAALDPVIVVLGYQADRARWELDGLRVTVEVTLGFLEGISASLRTGISAVPPEAAAAIVMLADMPLVTGAMVATLVERYRKGDRRLVVSDYDGVKAPPVLYDRSLFAELLAISGDSAGREVVERHRAEVEIVRWPSSALQDLDVPADYEQVRGRTEPS